GNFLDLNGDGSDDFAFGHDATDTGSDGQTDAIAVVFSDPSFVMIANDAGFPSATRFGTGSTIDAAAFADANKVGVLAIDDFDLNGGGVRAQAGNWYNGGAGTIGYVGFAMTGLPGDVVGTDYHFGWMRVGVSAYDNTSNSLVITAYDYAYESVAGVGITIPEPAGWALFAAGGTALAARRRRRTATTA
ncbi:PEP-CTERM sorting domain-containing protein, partial [Plasticicumulans sp.]